MLLILFVLNGLTWFLKAKLSWMKKAKIFYHWFRILLKTVTWGKWFRSKKESFLGFKVEVINYRAFGWLFDEIFFRNTYYFEIDKKRPVILDCGANIGITTLYFKWLFPESVIYCFEPDPISFQLLKKNIEVNKLERVYPFQVAVTGKKGKIDFYSDITGKGSLTNSVFREHFAESTNSSPMKRTFENLEKKIVSTVSLSDFFEEHSLGYVDFLKIDIEGMEEEVVIDLSKNKKWGLIGKMIFEYHHRINQSSSKMGNFLKYLEKDQREYQLDAHFVFNSEKEWFQYMLLRVYPRGYTGSPGV